MFYVMALHCTLLRLPLYLVLERKEPAIEASLALKSGLLLCSSYERAEDRHSTPRILLFTGS